MVFYSFKYPLHLEVPLVDKHWSNTTEIFEHITKRTHEKATYIHHHILSSYTVARTRPITLILISEHFLSPPPAAPAQTHRLSSFFFFPSWSSIPMQISQMFYIQFA